MPRFSAEAGPVPGQDRFRLPPHTHVSGRAVCASAVLPWATHLTPSLTCACASDSALQGAAGAIESLGRTIGPVCGVTRCLRGLATASRTCPPPRASY